MFLKGTYQPETQAGESKVTVPAGSATSEMWEEASRMDRTKGWVAAVLPVEWANRLYTRDMAHIKCAVHDLHFGKTRRSRNTRRLRRVIAIQ